MRKVKSAFKVYPKVQEVWVDEKGDFYLNEKKGCRKVTREEAEAAPDEPEEEVQGLSSDHDEELIKAKQIIELLERQNKDLNDQNIKLRENTEKEWKTFNKQLDELKEKAEAYKMEAEEAKTNLTMVQESLQAAEEELKARNTDVTKPEE